MNIRAFLCTASLALTLPAGQTAVAQQGLEVGRLRCEVSAGLGLIITSSREMQCTFSSVSGRTEPYLGMIRKFGLDLGGTDAGVLAWTVIAPTRDPGPWALAGDYAGVGAQATVGAGLGANVLVGGSNRTISLQPLSVQAQTGLNVAGGVTALTLRPAP